jgi:hypothetical protein
VTLFSFNYTAVLNIVAVIVIAILVYLNIKHPMMMHKDHSTHSEHDMASMPGMEKEKA